MLSEYFQRFTTLTLTLTHSCVYDYVWMCICVCACHATHSWNEDITSLAGLEGKFPNLEDLNLEYVSLSVCVCVYMHTFHSHTLVASSFAHPSIHAPIHPPTQSSIHPILPGTAAATKRGSHA